MQLKYLVLSLIFFPFYLQAQPSLKPTGFSFLRIEPSARAMAMGSAYAGMNGDVNTFFYNPASLDPSSADVVSVSVLNYLADARATSAAYAHYAPKVGILALGVRAIGYGDFVETGCGDSAQESIDCTPNKFSAADVALTAGLARDYTPHIRYGVNVHGIVSRVSEYRASAVAADFGVVYHHDERGVIVSASALNVGKTFNSLGETKDVLPTDRKSVV